jgi:hypothetical protein
LETVEGAIEADVLDGWGEVDGAEGCGVGVGDVDLVDGCGCLVLEQVVAGAGEGAALGEDIDVGVHGDDLGHGEELVFFVVALVLGLDLSSLGGGDVLVEDVGVVVEPATAAEGDEHEEEERGEQGGKALTGEPEAGRPAFFCTAQGERDGEDGEDAHEAQPVGRRPDEAWNEVAITVHVRVGGRDGGGDEVECVLPTEVGEGDGHEEHENDDAVADELVRDDSLYEERHEAEDEYLGQDHQVEFLCILKELVVVVASNGLHDDATESGDGEHDDFDEAESGELGEPIGCFAHGQRIVDAGEACVALAPDEFGCVEGSDDVQEDYGAAFNGLQHEIGDGPDDFAAHPAGEVAAVESECGHEEEDSPEGNFVNDVRDADAGEGEELSQGGG